MKTTIVLEGASQLRVKLDALPEKVQRRAVRESVRSALKLYLNAAKRNARSVVGGKMGALLASTLYLKASKRTRRAYYGMLALFHTGRQQSGGEFHRLRALPQSRADGQHRDPGGQRRQNLGGQILRRNLPGRGRKQRTGHQL